MSSTYFTDETSDVVEATAETLVRVRVIDKTDKVNYRTFRNRIVRHAVKEITVRLVFEQILHRDFPFRELELRRLRPQRSTSKK